MNAKDQLRVWLRDNRRTQGWLASRMGVSKMTVSDWMNFRKRGRRPCLKRAFVLEELTGITARDWANLPEGSEFSEPPSTSPYKGSNPQNGAPRGVDHSAARRAAKSGSRRLPSPHP